MQTLDQWMGQPGSGPGSIILVALLLGLRHATDPDHIAAVSTLVLGTRAGSARQVRLLGSAWGLGHGTTLFLFGLPVVVFRKYLPESIHRGAELAVAAIIIVLAVRLLLRWHRGYFHAHLHVHDGVPHVHPHLHEHARASTHPEAHPHRHAEAIGRSPLAAFGIGLIHGIGGSAGAGILLVSAAPSSTGAVLALLLFALGAAVSMTLLTALQGASLVRPATSKNLRWLIPAMGILSLCFGVWYGLETLPT